MNFAIKLKRVRKQILVRIKSLLVVFVMSFEQPRLDIRVAVKLLYQQIHL